MDTPTQWVIGALSYDVEVPERTVKASLPEDMGKDVAPALAALVETGHVARIGPPSRAKYRLIKEP